MPEGNQSEGTVQPGISPAAEFYMGLKAEVSPGGGEAANGSEGAAEGDAGQGVQSQELDPGLYPGIESVPSEYRQHLDPILKEVEANANKRISEVNGKLDGWKEYEELGIREKIDPETMQGLIAFTEMLGSAKDDPSQLKAWVENISNEFGFDFSGEDEDDELFDEDEGAEGAPDIAEIVREAVAEQMEPFHQQAQSQQEQQQMSQVNERIDSEFNQIKDKFGQFSDNEQKNQEIEARIVRLAVPYATENDGEGAILKGFEEYQQILKDGEGSLFKEVSSQPSKPEGPGTPDTIKAKPTSFAEAEKIAKGRLSQVE